MFQADDNHGSNHGQRTDRPGSHQDHDQDHDQNFPFRLMKEKIGIKYGDKVDCTHDTISYAGSLTVQHLKEMVSIFSCHQEKNSASSTNHQLPPPVHVLSSS